VQSDLFLTNTQNLLAAHLRAVGRQDDALHAEKNGTEILCKLAETNPDSTAYSFHILTAGFRSIGLHHDALQAEEQAVALYHKVPQRTSALLRGYINTLESLAVNLRDLGREDDAAQIVAEVATLKSSLTKGPGPVADAVRDVDHHENAVLADEKDTQSGPSLVKTNPIDIKDLQREDSSRPNFDSEDTGA
jgi:hypothetical protein